MIDNGKSTISREGEMILLTNGRWKVLSLVLRCVTEDGGLKNGKIGVTLRVNDSITKSPFFTSP